MVYVSRVVKPLVLNKKKKDRTSGDREHEESRFDNLGRKESEVERLVDRG